MPSCTCPSRAAGGLSRPLLAGLIHGGKIDLYLSIGVGICIYMCLYIYIGPQQTSPPAPQRGARGPAALRAGPPLGFVQRGSPAKRSPSLSRLFVSRGELRSQTLSVRASSQLFICLCPSSLGAPWTWVWDGCRRGAGGGEGGGGASPPRSPAPPGLGAQSESEWEPQSYTRCAPSAW